MAFKTDVADLKEVRAMVNARQGQSSAGSTQSSTTPSSPRKLLVMMSEDDWSGGYPDQPDRCVQLRAGQRISS